MRIIKCLVTIALLGSASLSLAAGNPEAGEEKAGLCAGCHGDDGNAAAPIFPKLAGQHASYLIKQLHDFRSQKRVEPTMNAMAEPLTDEDVLDLAAFYTSKKSSPKKQRPTPWAKTSSRPATSQPAFLRVPGAMVPRAGATPPQASRHCMDSTPLISKKRCTTSKMVNAPTTATR